VPVASPSVEKPHISFTDHGIIIHIPLLLIILLSFLEYDPAGPEI
jgi:hypothetical protein